MPCPQRNSGRSTKLLARVPVEGAFAARLDRLWYVSLVGLLFAVSIGCGSKGGEKTPRGSSPKRSRTSESARRGSTTSQNESGNSNNSTDDDRGSASAADPLDVPQDTYAGIPQAIDALVQSAEQSEMEQRNQATRWLVMQGPEAVPPLADLLLEETRSDATRVAACRALGGLGPPAEDTLIAALDCDSQPVRVGAVVELSRLRPASPTAIATLLALVDDEDQRVRQMAIRGLGSIGPEAKQAVGRLVSVLNSGEDEVLRREAKQALQRIDPRRRLNVE